MATWKRGWSTILLARRLSLAITWAGMSRHQMTVSVPAIRRPHRGYAGGFGRRVEEPILVRPIPGDVDRPQGHRPPRHRPACRRIGGLATARANPAPIPA